MKLNLLLSAALALLAAAAAATVPVAASEGRVHAAGYPSFFLSTT